MSEQDTTFSTTPQDASTWLRRAGVALALIAILAVGAALRFTGQDWDEGFLLHPDERFMAWVASDLRPVGSLTGYFDTLTSTLNPNNVGHGFYVYGNLPVIVARHVGEWVGKTALYDIYLPGRTLSACADLLVIVFLFLTAQRLFDWRIGLLAAALYAGVGFAIQQSHFFTADPFTNLFVAAAFLFAARAFSTHHWADYPLFGLALGLAMASKVSIAPLALILIVALGLRVLRERRQAQAAPDGPSFRRAVLRAAAGLIIAGAATVIVFRVGQPYAFLPPNSGLPVDEAQLGPGLAAFNRLADPVGFRPNPDWIRQMLEVRIQVSGGADIPPNHQWGKRLPLVFPWLNMVRVGLGWPLGLFAWFAFGWALWEIGRGGRGSLRLVLPVTWVALFFTWQGTGWVTTMRYFLPIYPWLMLLAAWALITIGDRVRALIATRSAPRWHWSALGAAGLLVGILLAGYAWGFAVSRIYTRPVTRVAATRWMVEHIPSDVTLLFDTPEGPRQMQLGLVNDWPISDPDTPQSQVIPNLQVSYLPAEVVRSLDFKMPFDGMLTGIRLNAVSDPRGSPDDKTLSVTLAATEFPYNMLFSGSLTDPFPARQQIPTAGGTRTVPRGDPYRLAVPAIPLSEGTRYRLELQAGESGPLVMVGSIIAIEDLWDDALPLPQAPYNIWGAQYHPQVLMLHWTDTPDKRDRMQHILDHADVIVISSNRFYATLNRNPQRWPMTIAYYRALFSGELGFDLVGDFSSRPSLGPIEFYDDTAEEAWTVYDHPRVFVFQKTADYSPERTAAILNSVDLAEVVPAIARDARGRPAHIPLPEPRSRLDAVRPLNPAAPSWEDYDPTPRDLYSRAQPLAVIIWWALIAAIGWAAFPLLWVLFPGLPDRGYPLARVFGLLFGAWLAWLLASLRLLPWTGGTALLALIGLVGLSAALAWPRRAALINWLRANRGHLLIVEGGLALLFLAFVLIRLGNPDLWHPYFGGEKPMDLAYFNAVLRSRSFPPYDPWFAGGTINYYYFGFVIVGLPVKLLGIPVTLAYNLILPTLFALTGGAAFSAVFNLTAEPGRDAFQPEAPRHLREALRRWKSMTVDDVQAVLRTALAAGRRPYLAGLAAALLAVVLGNLDQIRTVLWGLATLGRGRPDWANQALPPLGEMLRGLVLVIGGQRLPVSIGDWYWNATRVIPVPISPEGIPTEVGPITEFPFFTFLYADLHAHMIAFPITLFVIGWCIAQVRGTLPARSGAPPAARIRGWLHLLLNGLVGALAIGALRPTNTWDYPTYLLLGAGTLAMAHFIRRRSEAALPALGAGGLGALALAGTLFALNALPGTPGLLLALAGATLGLLIGFGPVLAATTPRSAEPGSRSRPGHWITLLGAALQAAALAGATVLLFLPYIQNYQLGYDRIIAWEGSRTPLWAYVDILGLFLFVILSWLVIEIGGWLRGTRRQHLLPLMLGLAGAGIITMLAAQHISPVATLALPALFAALALFFRPGQPPPRRLVMLMLVGALALTLFVEVAVLAGDLSRMNTVFKFYLQVWMLLSVVSGAALGWLIPALRRAPGGVRAAWLGTLALLVFLAALYPLLATRAKVADRWNPDAPRTLDGMAYMPTIARHSEGGDPFSLEDDYRMLRWLQDNVEGNPVVLEGLSHREYLWGSRVSIYTGLPAVVGWSWHQRQQRPPLAGEVMMRHTDVREIYDTTGIYRAHLLLERYGVELVIVGELERSLYTRQGLAKFETMVDQGLLEVIYRRNNTVVYRVTGKPAQP